MQKIEYRALPSPHVIVENFLTTPAARDCLAEAQWLEPVYEEARLVISPTDTDGCEECVAQEDILKKGVRQNKIVYLDAHYLERRTESKILAHLQRALTDPSFCAAFASLPNLFPIINQTTHMETILSSYGKCDFYGWHTDTISPEYGVGTSRVITCVIHWNTEPKQYKGGELILTGETIQDQLPYEPVHNTAIFFQSNQCVHAVDETKFEGEFKDSRFSINLWLGFSNETDISVDTDGRAHKYQ